MSNEKIARAVSEAGGASDWPHALEVAQAALTAIMGEGDGVQEVDRELAYFIAGRSAREADFEQARRHRQLAAAAERARIVAWLRDTPWPYRNDALADAIERGEV